MKNLKEQQIIIDKYIKRIKTDYPEDDKLMIDLKQFILEIIGISGIIENNQNEDLCTYGCTKELNEIKGRFICCNCNKPIY